MGSATAIPLWRNVAQKLAVLIYLTFMIWGFGINLLLLFNRWTALPLFLYALYINLGSGRFASKSGTWPTPLRWLAIWRHMRDYFPCQLIKTADLDPSGRYIFCFAPHGVLTLSAWVCFDTEATGFAAKYPGIDVHPLTLEINFRLPFIREFLLAFGICDASRSSIKRILGKAPGSAVLLALGGAQESLHAAPGTYDLVLAKRKGFVKLALETGAALVPVIAFGENDLYFQSRPEPGSRMDVLQRWLKRNLGFTLPSFYGDGLVYGRGLMPRRRRLDVVVGAPLAVPHVDPKALGEKEFAGKVDEYHAKYVAHLKALWDAHKDTYGSDRRRSLTLVE